MTDKIVICGGGTGGHIFPGIAVAKQITKLGADVAWLGLSGGREESWVPANGIDFRAVKLSRKPGIVGLVAMVAGFRDAVPEARAVLRELNAACVLALGGYPSLPGALAALSLRIPLLIHEQNCNAGLANRLLSPFAKCRLAAFKGTFRFGNAKVVGTPLRSDFAGIEPPAKRWAGRKGALQILVLGGSAGAAALNAGVPVTLGELGVEKKICVVHQAGTGMADGVAQDYTRHGVLAETVEFIDNMAARMSVADLVISRAGGGAVAEICGTGVGSILVPYTHARGHQSANAEALERAGAALVVPEPQMMGGEALMRALRTVGGRLNLVKMAAAARTLTRPDAARTVAKACLEARNAA